MKEKIEELKSSLREKLQSINSLEELGTIKTEF